MSNLVKGVEEHGWYARADRPIASGRVVSTNRTTNTAILDVGRVDNDGLPVYMIDVPFSPQDPPQKQDVVAILRTNSSPYSHVIGGGAQVGGANTGQVVESGGAVTSIKKTGETSGQQGALILDPGANITITRSGKTFTFALGGAASGDLGGSYPAPTVVQASGAFALPGDITPAQITANTDNYNPTGLSTASTLRLSTDASRNLTGIVGGADGRLLLLLNVGAFPLVLKNNVTSTVGNRFLLGGADVTLAADEAVLLQYDATSSRWRGIGKMGSSGGGGDLLSTNNLSDLTSASTARTNLGLGTAAVHGRGVLLTLCAGFTPAGTGADIAEIVVPHDPDDGTSLVTWNVRRITLRVNVAGGAPVAVVEKSTVTNAAFGSGSTVGTLTMGSGDYEVSNTTSLGTVASNNKLRFNVTTLATATGWTIEILLGA